MKKIFSCLAFLSLAPSLFAIELGINKSIYVQDGQKKSDGISTVNGCIVIGKKCRVQGSCRSVNGLITVGRASEVKRLETVNGGIRVDPGVRVLKDIKSVNGPIECRDAVSVHGSIKSVNGPISLSNTKVEGDLSTYHGNISLEKETQIDGDVIIKDSKGRDRHKKPLYIRITDHSVVHGDIMVEDDDLKVVVQLRGGGKVRGHIYHAVVEE
jgi:DUF4097 and DUF4098 domain-containing protein YvlB